MNYSKAEMIHVFREWLLAWNCHDLEGVMALLHDDIVFENWNCATTVGKNALKRAWTSWFKNHGNFKFIEEDIFIDEQEQKLLFKWRLEWPSQEKNYIGKPEIRHGVDIIYFVDGKILKKYTYSKTTLLIDFKPISLHL